NRVGGGFDARNDVNGNGAVTTTDVTQIRSRIPSALPIGSPLVPTPAQPAARALVFGEMNDRASTRMAPLSTVAATLPELHVLAVSHVKPLTNAKLTLHRADGVFDDAAFHSTLRSLLDSLSPKSRLRS